MSEPKQKKYYWPTILLGVIVGVIFLLAIFTYQVEESEQALVLTFGKPTAVTGPGLHFRWPLPVQEIVKYDIRKRYFPGTTGKLEETTTKDKQQVVVGIGVFYQIKDVKAFRQAAKSIEDMEDFLSAEMSNAKKSVIGRYDYQQLINADSKKMQLQQVQQDILTLLRPKMLEMYGVDVFQVDIVSFGVPEKTADAIAETMRQQRETLATETRAKGTADAEIIKINAERTQKDEITKAEAKAKELRAQGDAQAAEYYKVFSKDPVLAAFLQKLDALKKTLGSQTTLILHTGNAPFDIFEDFVSGKAPAALTVPAKPAVESPKGK